MDALCVREGAFRYMHTRTTTNPEVRRRIDPNRWYAERAASATAPSALPSAAAGTHAPHA